MKNKIKLSLLTLSLMCGSALFAMEAETSAVEAQDVVIPATENESADKTAAVETKKVEEAAKSRFVNFLTSNIEKLKSTAKNHPYIAYGSAAVVTASVGTAVMYRYCKPFRSYCRQVMGLKKEKKRTPVL